MPVRALVLNLCNFVAKALITIRDLLVDEGWTYGVLQCTDTESYGPTLNAGLVALPFSMGSGHVLLKNPIAL